MSTQRILFLDALRIFAFLSVLAGHKFHELLADFAVRPDVHATALFMARVTMPLVENGGAGVVVFFLVSGYIITHVLQAERPAEFLIKRALVALFAFCYAMVRVVEKPAIRLGRAIASNPPFRSERGWSAGGTRTGRPALALARPRQLPRSRTMESAST